VKTCVTNLLFTIQPQLPQKKVISTSHRNTHNVARGLGTLARNATFTYTYIYLYLCTKHDFVYAQQFSNKLNVHNKFQRSKNETATTCLCNLHPFSDTNETWRFNAWNCIRVTTALSVTTVGDR